jgi:hypothetical protein
MDEEQQVPERHDPYGGEAAPDYGRPQSKSRRTWFVAGAIGLVVLLIGGFFVVKAVAGGGSSSTSTAAQTPTGNAGGGVGRRGTIGTLQSIDGPTLTVATFARGANGASGANGGGGAGAAAGTTTVTTSGSTKFYKAVSGALSDIKVGDRVTATGAPAGDNTVTAARITDTGTMNAAGFGVGGGAGRRARNGNNPNGTNPNSNGTPPSSLPNGGTRPDPNSFANGTVKSVSGTTLTVAENQGAMKTVNTTGSTTFSVLKSVGINDLTTGQLVIIQGKTNSDGTVSATNVVQGVGGGFGGGGFRGRFGGNGNNPEGGSTPDNNNGTTTQ